MRRILVLLAALAAIVAATPPATASSNVKRVLANQTTETTSLSIDYINPGGDLSIYWTRTDGTTRLFWITEQDAPLDYYGGTFRSYRLWWATLVFDDPRNCRYSDPPEPGSVDDCTEGDLAGSLRWDGYGNRHKELNSDGSVYAYYRLATLSGSLTWEGDSLVNWSEPITARIERLVTP